MLFESITLQDILFHSEEGLAYLNQLIGMPHIKCWMIRLLVITTKRLEITVMCIIIM